MRAARIHGYGGPEVLRVDEIETPRPGPREVLIEVHAASVNPVDWKIRSGTHRAVIRYALPHTLGLDVSGVVVELGAEVTRFAVGDEVWSSPSHHGQGTYAEYVAIDERAVARKPARLSHGEAASIPLVGLTGWAALVSAARVEEGERVLVQAGSGGVGSFSIQLAAHLGARVATTCSARNVELVKRLGAEVVVDYTAEKFEEALTGYDVVLDTLGGEHRRRALGVLRAGGRLPTVVTDIPHNVSRFGPALGVGVALTRLYSFIAWTRLRHGVRVSVVMRPTDGEQLARIGELVERRAIEPVIDRVFPLADIAEAHRYSQTGRARGKIVIAVR